MGMIITCQQVVLRLKDMQDWSALQNGTFVKKYVNFNFEQKLKDIIQGLKMKARFKNVALNVEFNFKANNEFANKIHLEQDILLESAKEQSSNLEDHVLLNQYLKDSKKHRHLPKYLIGDPGRLQQVANNII